MSYTPSSERPTAGHLGVLLAAAILALLAALVVGPLAVLATIGAL